MSFVALVLFIIKASIFLNVLAVGLTATFAQSTFLFRRPGDLFRAFISMNVVMPLTAMVFASVFHIHPAVKIALLVLSVSPVPPFVPGKAINEGANKNYTIGLFVAMALLAILTIPVILNVFQTLFGIALTMPFHSVAVVVLRTVLAPLLIGMLVHRLAPPLAERMARPTGIVASVILILGLLVVLIASARTIISLIGNGTLFALVIFASVGLLVGYAFARSQPDKRVVLALATCSRHPGVAAAIAVMNFPNQKLALPAVALYLIVSAILSGIASARWKNVGVSPSKFKKSMAA